ncbi:MAG: hypothetical protein CMO01_13870 [Thalassobius sp.]|nr:hypothetical protein [Thalassovita sp.]
MNIEEIIQRIEEVNISSNYWFFRTDHGELFDDFYEGGYIAIGWDYITQNDLRNRDAESIKSRIAAREEFDLDTNKGKGQATAAYNKLQHFINLEKEDIVIIPSRNSDKLAFGRILDEGMYDEVGAKSFIKRRKIQWIKVREIHDLNPIFYQVKSNQHTISSVNSYSKFIDREIGNLFKKGENTHYVLNIEKEADISFNELKSFIDNIDSLLININESLRFDENFDEFFVKVNLQSKGSLELIKKGKSLAVLAYLLFLSSCGSLDNERDDKIRNIIQENRKLLENTKSDIDSLRVNINEMTKPFENGD